MDDAKFKGKIFGVLRRLARQWGPRNLAKSRRKIDKVLYSCEKCDILIYEGASTSTFAKYQSMYDFKVIHGKGDMDHISPVIDPKTGFTTWDNYIDRLYAPLENWQYVCKTCHNCKTGLENMTRKRKKKT